LTRKLKYPAMVHNRGKYKHSAF